MRVAGRGGQARRLNFSGQIGRRMWRLRRVGQIPSRSICCENGALEESKPPHPNPLPRSTGGEGIVAADCAKRFRSSRVCGTHVTTRDDIAARVSLGILSLSIFVYFSRRGGRV